MKKLVALVILLLASSAVLQAQVMLPESGRLAGPLNPTASTLGDEFFNFPSFIGIAPPGRSAQSGWLEIQFGIPEGNLVLFEITFGSTGPDEEIEFTGGQRYQLNDNLLFSLPSVGTLNLDTGAVEDIVVGATFKNSAISGLGRLNRLFNRFNHTYPPELPPFVTFPMPPGFVYSEANFFYDADGNITGFDFGGRGLVPAGLFGFAGLAPYSFGADRELRFSNPVSCRPEVPLALCPTNETNPDGIPLAQLAFLHPLLFLRSDHLQEVPMDPEVPDCVSYPAAGGVAAEVGGKLYHISGSSEGTGRGKVNIYDPATGNWSAGPSMAVPVVNAQGAAIAGEIYVVGGRRIPDGPATNVLQVLDTETHTWRVAPPAPFGVVDAAVAVRGHRLFVFGGKTNRPNGSPSGNLKFSEHLQIFDANSGGWLVIPAQLFLGGGDPIYVTGASAVTQGTGIYFIGGMTPAGVSSRVLIFETLDNIFVEGPELLWGTYEASAARIGSKIYVVGGRTEAHGNSSSGAQVLNLQTGAWARGLAQPYATAASASTNFVNRLFIVGGRSMAGVDPYPGTDSNVAQYYDPARGWHTCDSQPLFNAGDVLSTAALNQGPFATSPGSQASIEGQYLADVSALAFPGADVPTTLGGVSITVNGSDAPILSVSPERVDFQIPYGVSGDHAVVALHKAGSPMQAPTVSLPLTAEVPHIFIQSCEETRDPVVLDTASALACHPDGSLNYTRNPVPPGGVAYLQMSGLGAVDTALGNGERAPGDPLVQALALPTVMVEGADGSYYEAEVLSATLAPGEVGIYDVQIVVPVEARIANRTMIKAEVNGMVSNTAALAVGTRFTTSAPVPCLRDTNPFFRACFPIPAAAAPEGPKVIYLDRL